MSSMQEKAVLPFLPQSSPDKVYVLLLVGAMVGGLWLSLQSAGYLLAFNVNTLMISGVIFTVTSANFIMHAKPAAEQLRYAALAVVPVALRLLLNMPVFGSYVSGAMLQAMYAVQVTALWALVAVTEESFRATMMNVYTSLCRLKNKAVNAAVQATFANVLWVLFHFIQRPFDPFAYRWYILWLLVSGFVMCYALVKGGLGSAALVHLLVNLTA